MKTFSIIVPVYKVENYLRACVDSVLVQQYTDYELILVDDGSPDGCPVICDEYAAQDQRVKVIHKENGGLSEARNFGIDIATGKYLLFLDSDDYFAENTLEKIAGALTGEPDVVFLKALLAYPDGKTNAFGEGFEPSFFAGKSKDEALDLLANMAGFHLPACFKLVRRELIVGQKVLFTKGIYGEDVDWSIHLYLTANRFATMDHDHYFYRQEREGQITQAFSEKRFGDVLFIAEKWTQLAVSEFSPYREVIYRFMNHQFYELLLMYGDKGNVNRGEYAARLRKLAWLLKVTGSKKAGLVAAFYKVFGLKATAMVVRKMI
jgi:glycosyltransferase involved in cell wall biosynthesis